MKLLERRTPSFHPNLRSIQRLVFVKYLDRVLTQRRGSFDGSGPVYEIARLTERYTDKLWEATQWDDPRSELARTKGNGAHPDHLADTFHWARFATALRPMFHYLVRKAQEVVEAKIGIEKFDDQAGGHPAVVLSAKKGYGELLSERPKWAADFRKELERIVRVAGEDDKQRWGHWLAKTLSGWSEAEIVAEIGEDAKGHPVADWTFGAS